MITPHSARGPGPAVRLAVSVAAETENPPQYASRDVTSLAASRWRSAVCRALAAATGSRDGAPGPVQLNVSLSEPLLTDLPPDPDADPRLGPTAEAIVEGKYVWVPYDRIRAITFDPPQDLRDQVWMPARFTWANDGTAVGFIPTRYPGTTGGQDPALLLARRTEFMESEHWSLPVGQRMLVTESAETALMDIRRLDLAAAPG